MKILFDMFRSHCINIIAINRFTRWGKEEENLGGVDANPDKPIL